MVRQLIGYDRYEGVDAAAALQSVDDDYGVYLNFFRPVRKLVEMQTVAGKTRKRYDAAQTPYRRVLASPTVDEARKEELTKQHAEPAPWHLQHRIEQNLHRLRKLARSPSL